MTEQPEIVQVFAGWLREQDADTAIAALVHAIEARPGLWLNVQVDVQRRSLQANGAPAQPRPTRREGPLTGLALLGTGANHHGEETWTYDVDAIYIEQTPSHERVLGASGMLTETRERIPHPEWPGRCRTTYRLRADVSSEPTMTLVMTLVLRVQGRRFRVGVVPEHVSWSPGGSGTMTFLLGTPVEIP